MHTEENTTEQQTKPKKIYSYVRVNIPRQKQGRTTLSVRPDDYAELAELARGSAKNSVARHVREVLRQSARELLAEGYEGNLSKAARDRARKKLRATFIPERAAAYDAAEFPEGTPVAA